MQTRRHGDGWAITTDPVWSFAPNGGGTSSNSMSNMVELYQHWTAAGWRPATESPLCFATQKAAQDYLAVHRAKM